MITALLIITGLVVSVILGYLMYIVYLVIEATRNREEL
jgi:hypothetical protein